MVKTDRFEAHSVSTMPTVLLPGILYVSEIYGTAAHLCACGCSRKVRTPLGPTEWSIRDEAGGPSLSPSVGGWQSPCRSHYVIERGQVIWCGALSEAQVEAGRLGEARRREADIAGRQPRGLRRVWLWAGEALSEAMGAILDRTGRR